MTRSKVELAYISNEGKRKATYNKRKTGIIKKLTELVGLCGIQASAIISNPFNSQPKLWPNTEVAMELVDKYQNTPGKDESKNLNQVSFLMQSISKTQSLLNKQLKKNREDELVMAMFKYMEDKTLPENLSFEDCCILKELIKKKTEELDSKVVA